VDIRTEAVIAAFVPSLLWLALVYSRDRYEREPKWLVSKLYVMSILAVAMAFVLESLTGPRLTGAVATVIGSALVVGLIEEGSKFAVLVLGTRRNPNPNEPVDGMVYATAVALGFAGIESLTYILRSYDVGLAYHLSPSSAAHLALVSTAPVRAPGMGAARSVEPCGGTASPGAARAGRRAPRCVGARPHVDGVVGLGGRSWPATLGTAPERAAARLTGARGCRCAGPRGTMGRRAEGASTTGARDHTDERSSRDPRPVPGGLPVRGRASGGADTES